MNSWVGDGVSHRPDLNKLHADVSKPINANSVKKWPAKAVAQR
jgi:hypothetical protein